MGSTCRKKVVLVTGLQVPAEGQDCFHQVADSYRRQLMGQVWPKAMWRCVPSGSRARDVTSWAHYTSAGWTAECAPCRAGQRLSGLSCWSHLWVWCLHWSNHTWSGSWGGCRGESTWFVGHRAKGLQILWTGHLVLGPQRLTYSMGSRARVWQIQESWGCLGQKLWISKQEYPNRGDRRTEKSPCLATYLLCGFGGFI